MNMTRMVGFDMTNSLPKGTRLISRGEWKFVAVLVIVLLVVTTIPYAYGYFSAPPDQQFMGLVFNVADHAQYAAWYHELQDGFLAEDKLTPEPNEPAFFNLLWLVLGRIGLWTNLGFAQMYQVFRVFAGVLFILMVYGFCALLFDEIWERKIASLVIACGSGLGWILVVLKYTVTKGELLFPLDVYRAGANSFLTIMAFAHFAFANSLLIGALVLILKSYQEKRLSYSWMAAIVTLVLGWQHAYDLLIIYSVMLGFAIVESLKAKAIVWHLIWTGLILGVVSGPAALYSFYLTRANPVWKGVLAQFGNAGVFTADPFHMIILVGLPFIAAVLTFDGLVPLQQRSSREMLVKVWFLVSFFLGYLPTGYQVHLTNCWQVPVGILAVRGLFSRILPYVADLFAARNHERVRRVLGVVCVLAVLPTSLYLLSWRVLDLSRHQYPYFLYKDDLSAMEWLETNSESSDVVLSALSVGQFIPAISGNKVFLGHWTQTLDFHGKTEMVERFFDDSTDDEYRLGIIREFDVKYVFWGQEERGLGPYNPQDSSYLVRVLSSPHAQLYRVDLEAVR
jgi:hypothetical protein